MMARGADGRDSGHRDRLGGFAMIEVMLALMLIAVLAALALPGLARTTGPASLRIAAFEISALLRQDRNVAESTGRSVATRLDVNRGRVMSGASSASVALPTGATARIRDASAPIVRFFADGRSSGGTILLATTAARYAVIVNRDTGAIRVSEP